MAVKSLREANSNDEAYQRANHQADAHTGVRVAGGDTNENAHG